MIKIPEIPWPEIASYNKAYRSENTTTTNPKEIFYLTVYPERHQVTIKDSKGTRPLVDLILDDKPAVDACMRNIIDRVIDELDTNNIISERDKIYYRMSGGYEHIPKFR